MMLLGISLILSSTLSTDSTLQLSKICSGNAMIRFLTMLNSSSFLSSY